MSDETAIVVRDETRLGALVLSGPEEVISRASAIARSLAKIVSDQKLYSVISGRRFVRVEGWTTMGAMLSVLPRERLVVEHENGDFEATVDLIRASDGAVIGGASAIVGADEPTWAKRPRYARRSMALTRATGKAYRLGFSWIMTLAGYEPTPAEEMEGVVEGEVKASYPPQVPEDPAPPQATMSYDMAASELSSDGTPYGVLPTEDLDAKMIGIRKMLAKKLEPEQRETYQRKAAAIATIKAYRANNGG